MSVDWAAIMVMIEDDRAWVLYDHMVVAVSNLLVTSENTGAEFVDEAT